MRSVRVAANGETEPALFRWKHRYQWYRECRLSMATTIIRASRTRKRAQLLAGEDHKAIQRSMKHTGLLESANECVPKPISVPDSQRIEVSEAVAFLARAAS